MSALHVHVDIEEGSDQSPEKFSASEAAEYNPYSLDWDQGLKEALNILCKTH